MASKLQTVVALAYCSRRKLQIFEDKSFVFSGAVYPSGFSYAYTGRGVCAGSFRAAYKTFEDCRDAAINKVRCYNPKAKVNFIGSACLLTTKENS